MTHGSNLNKTEKYTNMKKMCPFPYDKSDILYCKCVLRYCYNCTRLEIPILESTIAGKTRVKLYILFINIDITIHGEWIKPILRKTSCALCYNMSMTRK